MNAYQIRAIQPAATDTEIVSSDKEENVGSSMGLGEV
jgi:hypothetical protein